MLQNGFTTGRDLGEPDAYVSPIAVRNGIARGDFEGPHMLVAPHMMSPTGGHGDHSSRAPDLDLQGPNRVLTGGPDGVRQPIREELKAGADWIKIAVTGRRDVGPGGDPNVTTMSDAELAAAVDEAGVDNVEHPILIDDETIELMK